MTPCTTTLHDWKFKYCHPHNGEYWYECTRCGAADWVAREAHLLGQLEQLSPVEKTCVSNTQPSISLDAFVDALYEAGWRGLCDAQHSEIEKLWRRLWSQN